MEISVLIHQPNIVENNMPKKKKSQEIEIYRLKITLLGSKPPIWRRVEVPSHISLEKLHHIIQIVMGWDESHLWEIKIGKFTYSEPSFYDDPDDNFERHDAFMIPLCEAFKREKDKLLYNYDFGDYWEHKIVLEKKCSPEIDVKYPCCVDGELACPPEDCGGIRGFYDMLEALNNPDNEEHESYKEWVGEDYDPELFDIKKVNKFLSK